MRSTPSTEFSVLGYINGPGNFQLTYLNTAKTETLNNINAPLVMSLHAAAEASLTVTLGAATSLGSSLTVQSAHASNTLTLTHGTNYTLTAAGTVTLSTRGLMTQGTGVWSFGTYTQSGASSVFIQGGNVTSGNVTASAGTLTGAGSASVTLTSSGDVNLTGATVTADKLNLVMTGAGKTLTTTATLFGLKASAYTNIAASCAITAGAGSHLTTDAGAFLNIANTKVVTLPLYAAGATLVPNGPIGGLGTLAITMSDGDVSTRLGNILCPLTIASINTAAANRVLTVLDDPSLGAVTVSSSDDDKTTTLDLAGKNLTATAVTVGTRGVILGGEGVHHLGGNFDSSAGTWTPETCQVVFTKAATVTLAAGQSFYDLIGYAYPITLGANAAVSNIFAHVGPIVPGAFALTMTDPAKEYTGMRRPILRNLRTPIGLPPCCRPLLDGIERVSA
jgi:hypothetical protein